MVKIFDWTWGTFGVRPVGWPFIVLYAPWGLGLPKIPGADRVNIPVGFGWRFVVRR